MKYLIGLFALLLTSSVFAAPAQNVATGEPMSGTLLVEVSVLQQGLEDGTALPIFLNKDMRIVVPQLATPDGQALAAAASEWLSTPGKLEQLGRLIVSWRADYDANSPALSSQYPTLTDFVNSRFVEHLNTIGTGRRGLSAADQMFARATTLRSQVSQTTQSASGPRDLQGRIGDPAPQVNAGCGGRGYPATMHYCCTDTGDGETCEFCDCWGSFSNCCVYGPLELQKRRDY